MCDNSNFMIDSRIWIIVFYRATVAKGLRHWSKQPGIAGLNLTHYMVSEVVMRRQGRALLGGTQR